MSIEGDLQQLNDDLRSFLDNLKRDNATRRQDSEVTKRKVGDLIKFEGYLRALEKQLEINIENKVLATEKFALAKNLLERCQRKVDEANNLLQIRQQNLEGNRNEALKSEPSSNDKCCENLANHMSQANSGKMAEQFNFRTASAILPRLDGSIELIYQLVEGISFYETSLDDNSKPQLINYVLKICLSHRDRIRMSATYTTVDQLVVDLKRNFLPKQSAPALIAKLQASQQGNLSIDDYAKTVESLMADLTITQEGENPNPEVSEVIRRENEKLAIDIFAKGIQNREIRTILKARNYEKLSQAIIAAKEEASSVNNSFAINLMQHQRTSAFKQNSRYNATPSNSSNQASRFQNRFKNNYNNNRNAFSGRTNNTRYFQNKNKNNFNTQPNRFNNQKFSRGNYRTNNNGNHRSKNYNNRNFRQNSRMYVTDAEQPGNIFNSSTNLENFSDNQNMQRTFFRDPQ